MIPEELQKQQQWIVWRWVRRGERLDKLPLNPSYPRKAASSTDPTSWSTYPHAVRVQEAERKIAGVGFVLSERDTFCLIDFDSCVDYATGEIDLWVAGWLQVLGGYQELSPSGTGIHAIVRATLPGPGRKTVVEGRKAEAYDRSRFTTVTGRVLRDSPPEDAQKAVERLYKALEKPVEVEREIERLRSTHLTNEQIVDKARTAANGALFRKLYERGDWSGYPSQSEADSALISLLIFWTGGEAGQIAELFEQSALYRSPSEGKASGYVKLTIESALEEYEGGFYSPRGGGEEVEEILRPYYAATDDLRLWRGGRRPSARKALVAALITASAHGVVTTSGARFRLDIRNFSELSHLSKPTLSKKALPLLQEEGYLRKIEAGGRRVGEGGKQSATAWLLPHTTVSGFTIHSPHSSIVVNPDTPPPTARWQRT